MSWGAAESGRESGLDETLAASRRVLRWRIGAFAEYELSLVTPPQFMASTSAASLWRARHKGAMRDLAAQVAAIQSDVDVNIVLFEVDSASSNKMNLAHALHWQRRQGFLVFWVWCFWPS